ncbi:hypothetical protein IMCC26134_03735 [Verrucomicrobia bacterium IMCC26134]|nr:hypothetical protein IMCC26134_03735 [Verrucomicrobia bacterium IMCC26134]
MNNTTASMQTRATASSPAARLLLAAMLAGGASSAFAASQTWKASPTDANWATTTNWVGGATPGSTTSNSTDTATFNAALTGGVGGTGNPIVIDTGRRLGAITYDTVNVGALQIGTNAGPVLGLGSNSAASAAAVNLTSTVANSQIIAAPIQIYAYASATNSQFTFSNSANSSAVTLSLTGAITANVSGTRPSKLILSGTNTGNNTISGNLANPSSGQAVAILTKSGAGTWILSGNNTFSGTAVTSANATTGIQINQGVLVAQNNNALGSTTGSINNYINTGGTLELNDSSANGSINLNNALTLQLMSGGTLRSKGTNQTSSTVNVSNAGSVSATLGTIGSSDVFTIGNAANDLTGGASDTVLNVTGSGTVLLGQASNYAGKFSINSGTVQIGNATALGASNTAGVAFGAGSTGILALKGNNVTVTTLNSNPTVGTPVVENNNSTAATLSVSNTTGSSSYAGVLRDGAAGTLALTKDGASTLSLSGNNTYTGGTTVTAGTLAANSAGALGTGTVSVSNAATLSTNTSANLGSLNLTGGGTLSLANVSSNFISAGTVSISGSSNILSVGGSAATAGNTYSLISGSSLSASGISITGSAVANQTIPVGSNATIGRTTYAFTSTATALQLAVTGGAFNLTWNGGSTNWNNSDANWQKDGTGSNIAFFAGDNITIGTGDTITVDAGGVTAGPILVNNTSGTAALTGGNLSTAFLTKSGAGNLSVGNAISATSTEVQGGTMTLNTANALTGAITVSGGTLAIGTNGAAGNGTATVTVSGGQLDVGTRNQSVADLTLSSGSITGTTGVLSTGGNAMVAQSGSVSAILGGTGGLSKTTAGTVVLTGANTYSGATTIASSGILQIGNGGTSGSIASTSGVANSGTLDYNRSDASTVDYVVSGAGTLVKDGSGTISLTNTNTYTGATTINSGTLQVGNGGTTGSISNTSGVTNNSILAYNRSDAITVTHAISGNGSVVKDGAGTLTLNGDRTYSGGTTLNAGTLAVGSSQAAGTGTITAANGTTIAATSSLGTNAVGEAITLSGSNATVTLTNNNASGGFNSVINGSAGQTLVISSAGGTGVNMNLQSSKQLQNFYGTVSIASGNNLTFRSTSLNQGSDNALFQVDGSISTRNNGNVALGALSGSGTVSMGGTGLNNLQTTYTIGGRNTDANFSGVIQDSDTVNGKIVNVVKTGTGVQTFSGVNTYTGSTTVNNGTLVISSTGSLASTNVTIGSGASFKYNGASAFTGTLTINGGTVSGSGALNVDLALNSLADHVAPGNSPGIQTFGADQNWSAFTYDWEVNDFTGTVAGTAFDKIAITGSLTLNSGNAYQLNVLSLDAGNASAAVPNFSEATTSWTIASTTTGITGFNAANWTVDASNFINAETGSFTLAQVGNDLVLTYAAIPEPSAYAALAGLGIIGFAAYRRRRNAKQAA